MLGGSYLFSWGQYSDFQGSMLPPNPTELGPTLISWCFPRHALGGVCAICGRAWSTEGKQVLGVHVSWLKACTSKGKWPVKFKGCWDPCTCDCKPLNLLPVFSHPQMIHSCQCPQCSGWAEKKWGLLNSIPLVWGSWEVTSLSLLPMEEIGAESLFWHQIVPPGERHKASKRKLFSWPSSMYLFLNFWLHWDAENSQLDT